MNKKILLPLLAVLLLIAFITIGILQYRAQRTAITETVPLIPATPTPSISVPEAIITRPPGIPSQTNIAAAIKPIANTVSLAEKDKVFDSLPLRKEGFVTSVNITTIINIFSLASDPDSAIRLEIYGINYNLSETNGVNAIAFKESFLEAKTQLVARGVNLKNLQIIYGNRQYIQDVSSYWVTVFKLLD